MQDRFLGSFLCNGTQVFFDACYNPEKTQFLLDVEKAGGRILNGLGKALRQGAAQLKLWTGQEAQIGPMRQEPGGSYWRRGPDFVRSWEEKSPSLLY